MANQEKGNIMNWMPSVGLDEWVKERVRSNPMVQEIAKGFAQDASLRNMFPPQTATAVPKPPLPTETKASAPITPTQTTGMAFDEAIAKLRVMFASIPSNKRKELIPLVIEKMKPKVNPEDRDAFETIGLSFIPSEQDETDNMLKRMLPIMLIMSMLRRD